MFRKTLFSLVSMATITALGISLNSEPSASAADSATGPTTVRQAEKNPAAVNAGAGLRWVDEKTNRTLFSVRDIVRFDWDQQVFQLSRRRTIDLMGLKPKPPLFKIQAAYPPDKFTEKDLRFSDRLKAALKKAGVLGKIDLAEIDALSKQPAR